MKRSCPLETKPPAGSPKIPLVGSEGTVYHVPFSVLNTCPMFTGAPRSIWKLKIFVPTIISWLAGVPVGAGRAQVV